jgi:hypothetical protein
MMFARFLACCCSGFLLTGCGSTAITNLTPSQTPRSASGLYPFEVALDSNQQTIRKETLTPYVLVGTELFPMKPAAVLKNRWETVIPIPAGQQSVHYRYKFDYQYATIPQRRMSSKLSAPYRLEIVDEKQ